jgi:predicted NUDIX family NTP pyrophosphohydrolase
VKSAGILVYRFREGVLEVLLAHPGGPFWARKDDGAWTIPKGEVGDAEEPLAAARRELLEETGLDLDGDFIALTPVRQKSGKWVHAWALEGDCDPAAIRSNVFSLEWPPKSGKQREFPEIDRAGWFAIPAARTKILPAQIPLLDELKSWLQTRSA